MTDAQIVAIAKLCDRYKVPFQIRDYTPQFDLPAGYVAGWIGGVVAGAGKTIYIGCDAEGRISS